MEMQAMRLLNGSIDDWNELSLRYMHSFYHTVVMLDEETNRVTNIICRKPICFESSA